MIRTYDEIGNSVTDNSQAVEEYKVKSSGRDWCPLGAIVGLSGGLIAAFLGSLLTAISWFTATEGGSSMMRTLGTILLFVTIPLLAFGAHCLDLREAAPKEGKRL